MHANKAFGTLLQRANTLAQSAAGSDTAGAYCFAFLRRQVWVPGQLQEALL